MSVFLERSLFARVLIFLLVNILKGTPFQKWEKIVCVGSQKWIHSREVEVLGLEKWTWETITTISLTTHVTIEIAIEWNIWAALTRKKCIFGFSVVKKMLIFNSKRCIFFTFLVILNIKSKTFSHSAKSTYFQLSKMVQHAFVVLIV